MAMTAGEFPGIDLFKLQADAQAQIPDPSRALRERIWRGGERVNRFVVNRINAALEARRQAQRQKETVAQREWEETWATKIDQLNSGNQVTAEEDRMHTFFIEEENLKPYTTPCAMVEQQAETLLPSSDPYSEEMPYVPGRKGIRGIRDRGESFPRPDSRWGALRNKGAMDPRYRHQDLPPTVDEPANGGGGYNEEPLRADGESYDPTHQEPNLPFSWPNGEIRPSKSLKSNDAPGEDQPASTTSKGHNASRFATQEERNPLSSDSGILDDQTGASKIEEITIIDSSDNALLYGAFRLGDRIINSAERLSKLLGETTTLSSENLMSISDLKVSLANLQQVFDELVKRSDPTNVRLSSTIQWTRLNFLQQLARLPSLNLTLPPVVHETHDPADPSQDVVLSLELASESESPFTGPLAHTLTTEPVSGTRDYLAELAARGDDGLTGWSRLESMAKTLLRRQPTEIDVTVPPTTSTDGMRAILPSELTMNPPAQRLAVQPIEAQQPSMVIYPLALGRFDFGPQRTLTGRIINGRPATEDELRGIASGLGWHAKLSILRRRPINAIHTTGQEAEDLRTRTSALGHRLQDSWDKLMIGMFGRFPELTEKPVHEEQPYTSRFKPGGITF